MASVHDLGALHGPVLVFGGAYSNLQALQGMLSVARQLHIPPERIIHTGDVVAYCAQPRETTELLRESGICCLMGNCEESIGIGKTDCGCGFPEDSRCNEFSVNWYAHVTRELKNHPELRSWMASLPRRIAFKVGGRRFHVVHGSPRGISEFLWPSTSDEELLDAMVDLPDDVDGVVSGHSGIPFVRLVPAAPVGPSPRQQRLWLNGGVVGMPANDGTSRAWFAVLTPLGAQDLEVSVRALDFDAKAAAEAIYAEPRLNRGYADALVTGIWPSHDILPLEEQLQTGIALPETKFVWTRDKEPASPGLLRRLTATATCLASAPDASAAFAIAVTLVVAATTAAAWAGHRYRSARIAR